MPPSTTFDHISSKRDLTRFRDIINDAYEPLLGYDEDLVDVDRNGRVTPFDLLVLRQLHNGSGSATRVWDGEELPSRP